ncbi:TIGR03557 family F420-dependent LLM class oxidoreductase [Kitasatospora sp. NPDC059673]|uniref:TIGR03557 family F420-dependent LLM class oxidoreductase n=1 Tax=Kitasatospora sp. NPDC059673 TaxID=3346901 RepID=UPI0036973D20
MTEYGYFLSCEEYAPAELLDQARRAEQAGFTRLAISDHFHPWTDAQGNSPFVWSMIGAISQVSALPVTTLVTCPTVRLHPVVTAQAAATSSVLTGGRFRLGLGTGEALNEHVVGGRWPSFAERAEMLAEAVRVIRALFAGGTVNHRGRHYTVDNARLYTAPDGELPLYVSAFGPRAAKLAADLGDGLVTTVPDAELLRAYRESGGTGPTLAGTKACWAPDEQRAVATRHRLWASEYLPGELNQLLPTPHHFEQAIELVPESAAAESGGNGPDPQAHLALLRPYLQAGFDEVYVGQIGGHVEEFFDCYRQRVLPELTS